MRILLLNQFFWPDSAATSQLLTDLARELATRGHEVIAVCGSSVYASGESSGEVPAVEIRRAPAIPFGRGTLARVLSYGSFLGSACWAGLTSRKPDLVLSLTTPPLLPLVGALLRATRGSRYWIWEMDVYPDVAVALGYLPEGGIAQRVIGAVADLARRKSDGILVLGECMRNRLLRRGIDGALLHIADNWADSREIEPVPFPEGERLRVLYSGNLGLAHDIDTVREAMLALRNEPTVHFDFAGGGSRRKALESWCAEQAIAGVEFRKYTSRESLGESLGRGHIGLVTQRPDCLGAVVPSKVYGLMAAGRPILFIGPKEAQPNRIIQQFRCGWQIDCGDSTGLADLLRTLAINRDQVREAGLRGRHAFLDNYDLPQGVRRIVDLLEGMPAVRVAPISQTELQISL